MLPFALSGDDALDARLDAFRRPRCATALAAKAQDAGAGALADAVRFDKLSGRGSRRARSGALRDSIERRGRALTDDAVVRHRRLGTATSSTRLSRNTAGPHGGARVPARQRQGSRLSRRRRAMRFATLGRASGLDDPRALRRFALDALDERVSG